MTIREKRVRATLGELRESVLRPAAAVAAFGPTLVIAAHPEDESLGCGGAIALLRRLGVDVRVLVLSDGPRASAQSRRIPSGVLRQAREREALAALEILGVPAHAAAFLRLEERAVPGADMPGFDEVAALCRSHLASFAPSTVLLPWRGEPHHDYRAAWQLVEAARAGLRRPPRLIEYPVWMWGTEGSWLPHADEVRAWRLDIRPAQAQKHAAIAAYRSQLIASERGGGFGLSVEMLTHAGYPWELFLEF